jgi:hypothetical protein
VSHQPNTEEGASAARCVCTRQVPTLHRLLSLLGLEKGARERKENEES